MEQVGEEEMEQSCSLELVIFGKDSGTKKTVSTIKQAVL